MVTVDRRQANGNRYSTFTVAVTSFAPESMEQWRFQRLFLRFSFPSPNIPPLSFPADSLEVTVGSVC